MTSPALYLAPFALLLPALSAPFAGREPTVASGGGERPAPALTAALGETSVPEAAHVEAALRRDDAVAPLRVLERVHAPPPLNQVRIERRVVVRISPSPQRQSESILATLPRRPIATTYAEIEHGECVSVGEIAGVSAADGERLLLFLRDRQVLTAALERSCNAQAFYSGFYVEHSEDGNLCVARDRLQSRSGASCQLAALHRLVAIGD